MGGPTDTGTFCQSSINTVNPVHRLAAALHRTLLGALLLLLLGVAHAIGVPTPLLVGVTLFVAVGLAALFVDALGDG